MLVTSLGGAVVQHIVTDPESNSTLLDLRRYHDFVLNAYSFHAIEVQSSRGSANEELGNMTSVTVAGEILEPLGNMFRYHTISGH